MSRRPVHVKRSVAARLAAAVLAVLAVTDLSGCGRYSADPEKMKDLPPTTANPLESMKITTERNVPGETPKPLFQPNEARAFREDMFEQQRTVSDQELAAQAEARVREGLERRAKEEEERKRAKDAAAAQVSAQNSDSNSNSKKVPSSPENAAPPEKLSEQEKPDKPVSEAPLRANVTVVTSGNGQVALVSKSDPLPSIGVSTIGSASGTEEQPAPPAPRIKLEETGGAPAQANELDLGGDERDLDAYDLYRVAGLQDLEDEEPVHSANAADEPPAQLNVPAQPEPAEPSKAAMTKSQPGAWTSQQAALGTVTVVLPPGQKKAQAEPAAAPAKAAIPAPAPAKQLPKPSAKSESPKVVPVKPVLAAPFVPPMPERKPEIPVPVAPLPPRKPNVPALTVPAPAKAESQKPTAHAQPAPRPEPKAEKPPQAKTEAKPQADANLPAPRTTNALGKEVWQTDLCRMIDVKSKQLEVDLGPLHNDTSDLPAKLPVAYYKNIEKMVRSQGLNINAATLKKNHFVCVMLPIAIRLNAQVFRQRLEVIRIAEKQKNGEALSAEEQHWMADIRAGYRLQPNSSVEEILTRVDVVPLGLLLAQAAQESGWGTSRMAELGNNLFGITATKNQACLRSKSEGVCYRKFPTVIEGINEYIRLMNSGSAAFAERFRAERAKLRAAGQKLDSSRLAGALYGYAGKGKAGQAYIGVIRNIMTNSTHNLAKYEFKEEEIRALQAGRPVDPVGASH